MSEGGNQPTPSGNDEPSANGSAPNGNDEPVADGATPTGADRPPANGAPPTGADEPIVSGLTPTGAGQPPPKDTDRHFVQTVLQEGLLSQSQVEACKQSQERLASEGQRHTLAEIAASKTLVSQSQVDRIESSSLSGNVPKMAGNYQILRQIGEGGMGRVYKAKHVELGNYAAVKFLPPHLAQDQNFIQRFEREAKLAAQLNSPYSVRVFDVVDAEGMRLIMMEYVEGESLDDLLSREGRMEEKKALRVIRDVATALDEAHEAGIIHRDIKPGNILLTRRGVPKVADLGLAKNVESGQVGLTSAGAILGTPSYMSPEQAMGLPDLDMRTDIFSLGATFYRMVVGDLPFKGETPVNVMHKIATQPLNPPLTQNPALSEDTAAIICKMMAKDRAQRYQSMTAVSRDIETILAGEKTGLKYEETVSLVTSGSYPVPPTALTPQAAKKRKVLIGVAALVLLLLVGAWAFGLLGGDGGGGKPQMTAAELLAAAQEATEAERWERARSLSQELVDKFPDAPQAAEAKPLLGKATREAVIGHLVGIAAEGEVLTALAKLEEAQEKWPDDERIAGLQTTVMARVEKAYSGAMERGAAADKAGDVDAAVKAYDLAARLRGTDEAKAKLEAASSRQRLVQAGRVEDVREKLLAITKVLQDSNGTADRQVQAKIEELIGERSKALTARECAGGFRAHMTPDVKSTFLLAEEKFVADEKKLQTLQPLAMTAETLDAIITDLADVETRFTTAASATFDKLYPDLDGQLAGEAFAAGLLRLHAARENYPEYSRVRQLVAEHDPDGNAMATAAIVATTRVRASDYDSAKDAEAARGKLDEALKHCKKFAAETEATSKALSLKALVLARRAAAHDAAGAPLPALADASAAADLTGDERAFADLLAGAAADAVKEFGAAFKDGKAREHIERIDDVLGGKKHEAGRWALGRAMSPAAFARAFMRDAALVRRWSETVAAFEPPGMAPVPAGAYSLGLKYTGLTTLAPSNSPEHPRKLKAFFIDPNEITNEQFQEFVADGGYVDDAWWAGTDRKDLVDATGKPGPKLWRNGRHAADDGKLPVVGVSFREAAAYARWAGKRLPTETEWECAALGVPPKEGQTAFGKRSFPWGNGYKPDSANLDEAKVGKPAPVGSYTKDRSAAGCFDMAGNVREWTSSTYDPYPGTKCRDKKLGKGLAAVRGASFADSYITASPTTRRANDRAVRDARIGFRCAWSPPAAAPEPEE